MSTLNAQSAILDICRQFCESRQPRPQGLLLVQNGDRRNPCPRLPKWLQKFVRILPRKHDEMSSFCLNNGFRLHKTNRAARRWKQRPKKPFHHVSRDKTLHDSWSISAALARGFSDRHFERREGPGDEVAKAGRIGKSFLVPLGCPSGRYYLGTTVARAVCVTAHKGSWVKI